MENFSGTSLKGYDLHERIGAGGFGAVYRAYQSTVGREVAVKIILPGYANQPHFIRRFETEAQIVARLEHLHIVPLHDYWRDPDGAYIVMRYLRGGSLKDLLAQGPLGLETAAMLLDQIASALTVAHRNQVIHRDIKPANILLDEDGNGYLADFGIAKDIAVQEGVTDPSALIGSPDYLAPEQARTEPVTPRTDIYSLGVVLYEMLCGEHPFPGLSPVERLYAHLYEPVPAIQMLDEGLSANINEVIVKATTKDPAKRFADVMAMTAAFREAAALSVTQVESGPVELLTPREQEVLKLIIKGKSNREIADILTIEISTVKTYVNHIYRKVNVRSRVQAIVKARELNLIVDGFEDGVAATTTYSQLPPPENPYKGLRAFTAADEKDFFGRERMISKLLTRLEQNGTYGRFLAVVGPSGSGKSSLVRAGLIPALWRGELNGSANWYIADFIPGERPLDELEVALLRLASDQSMNLAEQLSRDSAGLLRAAQLILPDEDSELLIVIDQFEEVFTLVEDEAKRAYFLDLLHSAVTDSRSRVRVVVTMRADFYDRPLHYPHFGEMIRERMETVLPLGAKELERAIVDPAKQVGVGFEEGLVATIIEEINYQPGALPLLQYALTELFEVHENRRLTHEAYKQIGRAVGALAARADEIYQEFDGAGQETVRQMFLRLVTLGEGVEDTRRRVGRAELLAVANDPDLMDEVIDAFAAYRLLSLDHDPVTRNPTVEVAHEALLREWDRLRQWLNDSREDIRQERSVARAAAEWVSHQRDGSFLLRGRRLEQIKAWQTTTTLTLTSLEHAFIGESLRQQEETQQLEAERHAREVQLERRSRKFLRGLVAVFAIAVLVAGGLSVFAFSLNRQSRKSAAEFRSIGLSFGAEQALDNGQPDVALSLAREAVNMQDPPLQAWQMFYQASSSNWMLHRFHVSDVRVWDVAYLPDSRHIITASDDRRIILWNLDTGEEVQSIEGDNRLSGIGVHADGNLVAISEHGGLLQLWNLETGEVRQWMGEGSLTAPIFSADGTRMVTTDQGTILVLDVETLEVIDSWEDHTTRPTRGLHFNSDETRLITASLDGFVKIWDVETHELIKELDLRTVSSLGEFTPVWDAQFLPGDDLVLIGGGIEVYLWDWQADEFVWALEGEEFKYTQDIVLSPDRQTFAVGFENAEVELRDVATGQLIHTYKGHNDRVQNVGFSPDGQTIASASVDGTVIVWPVDWEGAVRSFSINEDRIELHPTEPLAAVFGPGTIDDLVIQLVNTDTGDVIKEFGEEQAFGGSSLAFAPDGRYLISVNQNAEQDGNLLVVWDLDRGEPYSVIGEQLQAVLGIGVSNDGSIAWASEAQGQRILLWDLNSGELISTLQHQEWLYTAVFTPDDRYIFTGGRDGSLLQWDVQTGEIISEFSGHEQGIRDVDLNGDGTRLITGSADQTAAIWDTNTGERLLTLQGHTDVMSDVSFSPNDRFIVTASWDGTIVLWDAQTGERLRTYVAYQSFNYVGLYAGFSFDGQHIISSHSGRSIVWDASPLGTDMMTWVSKNRYIADFTCEQRALYVIEPLCDTGE